MLDRRDDGSRGVTLLHPNRLERTRPGLAAYGWALVGKG